MKINIVGSGTMGSITRGNQSIVIDDILIDVGSGVVKQLERLKIYTKSINYLVITHSHADHFVDLPNFFIGRAIRGENTNNIKVICGKGIREKVINLFELTFGDEVIDKYNDFEQKFNVSFVELANNESYEDENIKITGYELLHGTCKPILGYVIEKENKKVGYATDTIICEGVHTICGQSDIAFLDATSQKATGMHMGMEDIIDLAKQYPNKKLYAIHRSDYEYNDIEEIGFPNDGDIIEI